MSEVNHQLRNLPSVDEVLRRPAVAELIAACSQRRVARWVRAAVETCRQRVLAGERLAADEAAAHIEREVAAWAAEDRGERIGHVINATGVLLHTNLGRAPLAARARQRVQEAAAYVNVELNLQTGRRSRRGRRVGEMIAELLGAEDAVVVNNCAAATMLVLQATAAGREVIVSRGQLVEIGGGFRLPEVFAAAGVVLREVGTTNRTYVEDYEAAAGEAAGAVIRVHRSNFRQTGFVTEPTIDELVACRRPPGVPVIDDVGSGALYDLRRIGLHEPLAPDSVAAGADAVLFSGDKLFGGPQCGIVVGRKPCIRRLRSSPMMRAMRIDKLTLAALEATVEIHLEGAAFAELPLLRMLTAPAEEVRQACQRAADELAGVDAEIAVVPCQSPVGGGSVPGAVLDSFGLQVAAANVDRLARMLRTGAPAVQPRVADDCLLLDFRTVAPGEHGPLVDRLKSVLAGLA